MFIKVTREKKLRLSYTDSIQLRMYIQDEALTKLQHFNPIYSILIRIYIRQLKQALNLKD